jgi:2-polyprenyl-3-methyl-5-hydroxy-6-metoxy-1,4-benzoquinol methylase
VDLDAETVGQLRSAGVFTNIRVGDAENLDACTQGVEPFDLVVAGDIIEHLSNPGKMLDGARRLLKPGGALLVSTPNAFGLMGFLRYLRGSFREGEQHVMSFNALNLAQLLARHGYRVTEALTCHQEHAKSAHKLGFRAGVWWFRRFPKWGGTLLLVAEPSR